MRAYIPSIFTLTNLVSGSLATVFILEDQWNTFYICFIICLLSDLFDGLIARWLNATSAIGRELDSLADIVSFGLVPGLILWQMLRTDMGMYAVDKLPEVFLCLPAF